MTNAPHPWAILDGDRPLFHTPGSYPPVYAQDEALEALWAAKRTTGLFMDSPYPKTEHSMGYHTEEAKGDEDVWFQSARWAAEHGDDKRFRIAVCGYMSPACDAMFPPTWERLSWEARGGYANQSKDGRGRANAKREMIWFSPNCLDPADEARAAFSKPLTVRASDYTGTMFEEQDDEE